MSRIRTFFLSFFGLVLVIFFASCFETGLQSKIVFLCGEAFASEPVAEEIAEPEPTPPPDPDDPDKKPPPDPLTTLLDDASLAEIQRPYTPALTAGVDDFRGSAHLDYPIVVPPGRKGLTPKLSLKYTSLGTNSWVGVGWDLSAGYIQRRGARRGVPKYDSTQTNPTDIFELSLNGGPPQDLVKIGTDEYRLKIEGPFRRIKYYSNYWEVTDKTGVKMRFGYMADSKIGKVKNPASLDETYRWLLDRIEDPNANYMELAYWRDQDTSNTFQVYLQEVRYNGNSTIFVPNQKITFNLETSYRSDKIYNYRGGFKMWTRKRLSSIEVRVDGNLVRRYQLQYALTPIYSTRSQLSSVKLYGSDNTNYLVPTNFTYFNQWSDNTEPALWDNPSACESSGAGSNIRDNGGYGYWEILDLNGDAVPDRATTFTTDGLCTHSTNKWRVYFNNGEGFNDDVEWQNQGYLGGTAGNAIRVWHHNPPIDGSKTDLIDMNGDGLPDRVVYDKTTPYDTWTVYYNTGTGSGFGSSNDWPNPSAWGSVNGNYVRNVDSNGSYTDVIDMNGDGLPDRVVKDKTSPYDTWTVYLNNGSGFNPGMDWSNPSGNGPIEGNYIRNTHDWAGIYTDVIDMNGDGLPDRVVKNTATGGWTVYFNTGSGFEGPLGTSWPVQAYDPCFHIREADAFGQMSCDLMDLNGDGLPDRLALGVVYYNTGSGFGPQSWWPFESGLYATRATDAGGTYVDTFDINGDGMPEQVNTSLEYPPFLWQVHPNLGPLPDLLQKVQNGIGGTIEFTYRPSTDYVNTYLPYAVQTVSSIKTDDGNGVISTTDYTYAGGFFSTTEREYRGFAYAKQRKPDQTTVETWFYNEDDIKKGLPYWQATMDSSANTYLYVVNTYNVTSPYPNVNFPYLERRDEQEYDAQQPCRQSAVGFAYDAYGNVTNKHSYGEVECNTGVDIAGDEKDENTQYFYLDNPTTYIVSLPIYKDVKDHTGTIKAKTWFDYDQNKGNLTHKTLWLAGDKTDSRNPVYIYEYDPLYGGVYGLVTSITDPRNNVTSITYNDPNNLTYTYPYQITKVLPPPKENHVTTLTYDPKFGKLKTYRDPNYTPTNDTTITYDYDFFGRLIKITKPYDESSVNGTAKYNYENFGTVGQQRIATLATEQSGTSNHIWRETYFDGLGRTFKTRQEGPPGKVIVTKTEYNTRGFVYRTSLPYFENLETPRWRSYLYDPMGRVTQITNPDNTYITMTHVKGVKTIIDENGHQKVEEKDVYGRLVKVKEYTGANPFTLYATTNYAYDVLDNLVTITDAATSTPNVTTMVYDPLSRKTEMTDPDMGHWIYGYDKNSNLTYQTDAKAQEIEFTYDELNRVTLKDYKTAAETDVVYVYDESFSTNSIGRLTTVTDASGTAEHYYDKLGRTTKTTKTVDSTEYTIETTYDPLDKTTSIKYPDDETIKYTYDSAGNLGGITDYAGSVIYAAYSNYNALGQPGTMTYSNGVTTTRQYYTTNNRLQSITTSYQSQQYQGLSYLYDNKGNVTRITDSIQSARTQDFGYDELDRLTSAVSSSYGTINYSYSEIGNMMLNSQVGSYVYGGPKPHAVTQAGANSYTYDDNGNMETGAGRTITNNYDNKPSSITIGGATTGFIYDYQGQRVKKVVGGIPTVYIGKLYECTSGGCTKYMLAGTTRLDLKPPAEAKDPQVSLSSISVASDSFAAKVGAKQDVPYGGLQINIIENIYAKQVLEGEQRAALEASAPVCGSNILYYHTDHLGSSNVITNSTGGSVEAIYYYPFGSTRLQVPPENDCVNHKFTGQEEDSETGLYNYGARYYDPALARFVSPDSIIPDVFNPQSLNRYSYVLNNPLRYTDPTGHEGSGESGTGIDTGWGRGEGNPGDPGGPGPYVVLGAGVSLVAITGFDFYCGFFGRLGEDNLVSALGFFCSLGPAVGVNISGDVFGGVVNDITGTSVNLNAALGPVSVTAVTDPNTGKNEGVTVGLGPSALPVGGSASLSTTFSFTFAEFSTPSSHLDFAASHPSTLADLAQCH